MDIKEYYHKYEKEILKQLGDQSLHLGVSIFGILGLSTVFEMVGEGNPVVGAALVLIVFWIFREVRQGKSSRWWDKPLDIFFEVLGVSIGVGISL